MQKHPELKSLGKNIRNLRKANGYSQEGFAAECGLGRSYYGGVERSERNISAINIMKIAKTLNVEVGDLFPPIKNIKL